MQALLKLIEFEKLKKLKRIHYNYVYYKKQLNELKKSNEVVIGFKTFKKAIIDSCYFEVYLKLLHDIKKEFIYKSSIHGLNHNLRVSLFAFYLANKLNLQRKDVILILYASFYHDIGRRNDCEDFTHGELSANKLNELNLDLDREDIKILKAIITGHSIADKQFVDVIKKYKIEDVERCETLYRILKDSDALDRVRLAYPHIKMEFLRHNEAKQLIPLAYLIEFNYNIIKENIIDIKN